MRGEETKETEQAERRAVRRRETIRMVIRTAGPETEYKLVRLKDLMSCSDGS